MQVKQKTAKSDENKKYSAFEKGRTKLGLREIERLKAGQKLSLSVFDFTTNKVKKFIFTFLEIEETKGKLKRHVYCEVKGKSKFLDNLPMAVVQKPKGEVRIVLSSDISAVFVEKIHPLPLRAKRPSPSESARLFSPGTKKKGGDGKLWVIAVTQKGVHRWSKA